MISKCTCENVWQDKRYGLGLRVKNVLKISQNAVVLHVVKFLLPVIKKKIKIKKNKKKKERNNNG